MFSIRIFQVRLGVLVRDSPKGLRFELDLRPTKPTKDGGHPSLRYIDDRSLSEACAVCLALARMASHGVFFAS